ncbi:cell division protein FtsL [Mariprofundus ferrinatatus]|uniref:Cell division protein FtsL n=1 Tax=Mariprofundus ferrinatatus TaxID=1921087 RepID=A0A2K8L5U2_9PROT|nr:cell division protein FtsL [Mariprofundus ferrinatatus]
MVPVLAGSLAAGQIWLSHLRYELSLETQKLNTEKQDVLSESGKLRLELASLTRPERLRKLAQEKLGMKPPGPAQVVHP